MTEKSHGQGAKLVHASLYRMGTMSMSEAYRILGLNPHHYHALSGAGTDWEAYDRAIDGKWPDVPGATPGRKPFTRQDWDEVRGGYDFFTDFYSHFTPELIKAYPDAKVVVVEREFESWWPSYVESCLAGLSRPSMMFLNLILRLFYKKTPIDIVQKQHFGFFDVTNVRDIDEAAGRRAHKAFFEEVRRLVPAEKRLEYKLSDGWEPLCKFLDKPVPDMPFPRLNTQDEFQRRANAQIRQAYMGLGTLVAIVVAATWYFVAR